MQLEAPSRPGFVLNTLGELRLIDPGGREPLAGRRKELALLVFMARRAPQPVSRGELAALLWGERPEAKARASLRQAILRLKRALGDALRVEADEVAVADGAVRCDLTAFEATLAAGSCADAVAEWKGEFLASADDLGGESYRIWLEQERERVRQRLSWAFERLVRDALQRGDHGAASDWAEQWSDALPLDERGHAQLVHALRLQGRLGDARANHRAFVARYRSALECDPSREFMRLATELEEPDEPAHGPTISAISRRFTPPIIGRASAFSDLLAAWERARQGSAALVVVEGVEGMGKSRICEELLRTLAMRGDDLLVLRAAAGQSHQNRRWSLLRELLSEIGDAPGLLGASPGTLADLSFLVPSLRHRFARAGTPNEDEWNVRDAVAEALLAISAEVPVLVFVDDLALSDLESARLILTLHQRLGRARVMLLVTTLSGYDPRALGLRLSIGRTPGVWRIPLEPFDRSEIELLLASIADLPVDQRAALARRLHEAAEGNPLFTLDTISALIAEGYLKSDPEAGWRMSDALDERPLPVPPRMRDAIARRLERLSADARRVAEAASLAKGPLAPGDLGQLSGITSTALYAAVDELTAQRWVADAGSFGRDRGRFAFAHESVRRAVALSVGPDRRAAIRRAARGLDATAPERTVRAAITRHSRLAVAMVAAALFLAGVLAALLAARR